MNKQEIRVSTFSYSIWYSHYGIKPSTRDIFVAEFGKDKSLTQWIIQMYTRQHFVRLTSEDFEFEKKLSEDTNQDLDELIAMKKKENAAELKHFQRHFGKSYSELMTDKSFIIRAYKGGIANVVNWVYQHCGDIIAPNQHSADIITPDSEMNLQSAEKAIDCLLRTEAKLTDFELFLTTFETKEAVEARYKKEQERMENYRRNFKEGKASVRYSPEYLEAKFGDEAPPAEQMEGGRLIAGRTFVRMKDGREFPIEPPKIKPV